MFVGFYFLRYTFFPRIFHFDFLRMTLGLTLKLLIFDIYLREYNKSRSV